MPWTLLTWGPTKHCRWHVLTLDMRMGRSNATRQELISGRMFLFTRICMGPLAFTYQRELRT
jgi:hypothetical protein